MKSLSLLSAFALSFSVHAAEAPKRPIVKLSEFCKDCKTVGDFVKRTEGKVSPYVHAYVKDKLKKMAKLPFEARAISEKKLIVRVDKVSASIEFLGPADGSDLRHNILVNNKDFEFDVSRAPEYHLAKIVELLPQHQASTILDWLLPRAEAQGLESFMTGMMGGLATGLLVYSALNSDNYRSSQPTYTSYSCYGCGQTWGQTWYYQSAPTYYYYVPAQPSVVVIPRQPAYYYYYPSSVGR